MEVEAIRSMTIEEIVEHLERISGALREGFDACGRVSKENPDNHIILVMMEGMQELCSIVASDLYATFGIGSGVAGGLGDGIAENGTRGKWRIIPEWVKRAKLCVYWRHAMQAAGVMDRAALETAFAAEYASRWRAEKECARLREKYGWRTAARRATCETGTGESKGR